MAVPIDSSHVIIPPFRAPYHHSSKMVLSRMRVLEALSSMAENRELAPRKFHSLDGVTYDVRSSSLDDPLAAGFQPIRPLLSWGISVGRVDSPCSHPHPALLGVINQPDVLKRFPVNWLRKSFTSSLLECFQLRFRITGHLPPAACHVPDHFPSEVTGRPQSGCVRKWPTRRIGSWAPYNLSRSRIQRGC